MTRDPHALLDRVRKLLSLASSPNIHEAAAAAARAQALIEQHRLEGLLTAESDPELSDGRDAPLESTKRLRKWKIVLAQGLAQANGCVAYTARAGRERQLLLAGRAEDREAVAAIWDWLVKQIEWCSATEGAGQDRAWHDGFRIGAAQVVGERLAEVGAQERRALQTTALARVEPALAARRAAVERFVEQELSLKPGRSIRVHREAYAAGQQAGTTLPLGHSEDP